MIRTLQKLKMNKLVIGFAGASIAAVVGAAGLAAAAPGGPNSDPGNGNGTPAAVAFCKDNWQTQGFKNQGQCVAAYQRSQGHGYGQGGSNNTVVTTVNNISGNNNFVETIINNIF